MSGARRTRRTWLRFVAIERAGGSAPKTVRNMLALLNSIYVYAERHGLVSSDPVRMVDKPRTPERAEVRFLDEAESEALLRVFPPTCWGPSSAPSTSRPP